ncbi:hypothetical protein [Corynebacterium guaraldiae]|uniref:hypothetical protein n=1 Tax=Corynebacterium guaraldiae TaxID=3051103 RepID=UPI0012B925B0|nr:hypothetical protein [Corynebacterium guaraldiae]MTD96591.1 hypothetical protein [Corynebacterium guaraldiae]
MLYLVPGALAGITFYAILTAVSWAIGKAWPQRRLSTHSRLTIHCLAAVAFSIFLAVAGGGGNWATHLQISGFLLAGCVLSFITAAQDKKQSLNK